MFNDTSATMLKDADAKDDTRPNEVVVVAAGQHLEETNTASGGHVPTQGSAQ